MHPTLNWDERTHYHDRLRTARYAALADAEAFSEICFVIEALGVRLVGEQLTMGGLRGTLAELANDSFVLTAIPDAFPALFSHFGALYRQIQNARNDAMHTGVYARHVTVAAIQLCIGFEEALMTQQQQPRTKVSEFMVRGAVIVEPWHPVAYARQLMLMHSFTFLPVRIGGRWSLISEVSMAKFLRNAGDRKKAALGTRIEAAVNQGAEPKLELTPASVVRPDDDVTNLLNDCGAASPKLWVVDDDHDGIAGVLSPFELM